MEHSAQSKQPARLNKIPFIAADIVISLSAVGITLLAEKPLGVWTVAVCLTALFVGFMFLVTPFVLEFSLNLQARNEDLEKLITTQSDLLEDALERWNRLHADVKSMFESSKLNIAGYEGLLLRFDQRLEAFDSRLKEIERVGQVFESGLKDMAERAETLHAHEAQAWEARLTEHRDSIQQTISAFRASPAKSEGSSTEISSKFAALETQLDKLGEQLDEVAEYLATIVDKPDADTSETWKDPSGKYSSMLDRALGGNTTKPSLPSVPTPEETEPEEVASEENEDSSAEIPEEPDTSEAISEDDEADEVAEQPSEPAAINKEAIPILDDDFIDEVIPESEVEEEPNKDVDWPDPDPVFEDEDEETPALPEEPDSAPDDSVDVQTDEPEIVEESDTEAVSITASILIGIGDKIHVRGDGPGLSTDQGVEMEFINIGSYRWSHDGISEPVQVEFYLNDEIPSLEGPITLKPGEHIEISPDFP